MESKNKKKIKIKDDESSEILKKFKANPLLYIGSVVILVLVIVTFVGGDLLRKGGGGRNTDLTFGYYDKVPISYVPGNLFSRTFNSLEQYNRGNMEMDYDMRMYRSIWRYSFEIAAEQVAILQTINKSGYIIPEKTVDRQMAMHPVFNDENGHFSRVLYRQMSEREHAALRKQIKDDMMDKLFFNDLQSLIVPAGESAFFGKMASGMRKFDVVTFNVDDFPASEYLNFAAANSGIFRTIHLSKISVSSSEKEAKKILNSIKNGETSFEDAAKSQSQDYYADRGGDMGNSYIYELNFDIPNADIRNSVMELKTGELSDVYNLNSMWVFFRVEDEIKAAVLDDDAALDRVKSYVRNFEGGRMQDWAIAAADRFRADAQDSGIDNAIYLHDRQKYSFGPIGINYGNVELFESLGSFSISDLTQSEIEDMSRNDNFWKIAFSTPLETLSQPFVAGSKVLVLIPTEKTTDDEEKISEIKDKYSSYWANDTIYQSVQSYFLSSSKMDDRFSETFERLFLKN